MTELYYFEMKNFHGQWSGRTSCNPPKEAGPDGRKRQIRHVQPVPEQLLELSITQLEQLARAKQGLLS